MWMNQRANGVGYKNLEFRGRRQAQPAIEQVLCAGVLLLIQGCIPNPQNIADIEKAPSITLNE